MNPLASPSQLKETPGPDPIPVSDEELARLMPEMAGPEPVAVDLLAPENLDAYILAKEADEAAGGPGFLSRMGDAAVDLVSQVGMAGKLTGQNVLSGAGAVISADGEELKKALRRQVALTTQAAAAIGGSYAMTGETVKGAFKEVGTKLSVGYQDTPENRRKIYAVRQANDRSMRDVQGVVDDALLIADNLVGGLDLNTAYAPAERETMLRAAGGAAEVLDVAFTAGAAAGAKLGAKVASRTAIAAERAATSVGAEKVAELIKSTRAYAGSIPETLYRVAAETAGNKMPNFGSLMDSAKRLAVLQEERALIEAAEDSLTKTKALADNASKVAELRTQIERLQSEFVRRADEAALTYAGRPVTQQLAGGAVEMAGDVLSGTAERVQRGVDWLRNKRAGALGTSGEAVQAGDEVFERVAGVSPSMVERTAGWFNELGENVSAAGRLMRTMESSTPYFQRLAKETDGWTRFAAQNANRVEFVARLGRGAAEGIDGAVKGATVGGVFGLLQGDSAEGAGEGLVGGFFGGGLRTIRMERDPAMVRARQLGDIADARSRRTGLQQQLFDAAPRNLQLAASTFEATNPNLVVNFVRQKGSGGSYRVNPDGTGEATIDLDSKIPLVPLLAHEVSHHIARNPDIASDLKRRFLGDDKTGTPGFLTEMRDGTLQPKPEFQKFRDEYLSALRRAGKDTAAYEANPELILHEVIAEAGVSSLLATNASGEFAGIAALRRNARPIAQVMEQFARSEMVMNSGVLQRALMATGAVFTDGGQHAKGTGLFSADMSPELRSAVNQIIGQYDRMALSERGGQVESFSETPTIYSEQEIASNPELLDLVSSGFDVDVDEKTGKRKFLSAREAKKREQEFIDDLIQALDASPDLSPGRVRAVTTKDGRTIYSGKYIPADVLETLQSRNKYNPRQLETLAMVTDLLGKRPGNEVHFVYQPAMTRGSRLYKQRAVTNRVETPISILISKTGGVLINTLSQEKVLRNLEFFSRKGMLGAWGGDVRAARADLLKYIDNTVAGREGAEGLGLEKRDALNALFGQLTNVQKERNPVLQGMSDAQGRKIGVVQSRRIDRTNQMKVLDSSFRADYGRVSENLRPDILPVPERFTGTGEEGDRQSTKVDAPGFFKRFDIQEYTKGGKYFDIASGEDVTGRIYASGSIDVSTGKPSLRASDTQVEAPTSGRKIRTNLFKQSAGWKWVGEAPAKTSTLVSVEMGKDHLYTLNSQFDTPVEMARYEDKKSEPRLRPTTRGVLRVGEKVGEIEVRGRVHPVYDKITTATDAPGRGVVNRGEDSLQFRPEGNDNTTAIAADYVRKAFGREYNPHTVYDEAPEARLKEIADYFQNVAKHQPDAPEVLRSYRAMADETIEQYKAMIAAGIKPEPYGGKGEPYASSEEMMRDVRENKHLYFLRTDNAFGQGTQDAANPLLEKSGQRIGDFELLVNDVFRVVHDYFGHTQQGLQFGPRGEFNAWKSHSRMYSDEAQGAVAAETLAQNAWVNFGAHLRRADGSIPKKGEEGYVPPQDRPFGEQKNFLVPQELMQFRPEQIETPEFKNWFGDWEADPEGASKVVGAYGLPKVVFHGSPKEFTVFDPSKAKYAKWGAIGSWFAEDPSYANKFRASFDENGNKTIGPLFETYLNIREPAVYEGTKGFEQLLKDYETYTGVKTYNATPESNREFVDYLKKVGFDGIIIKDNLADSALNPDPQTFYVAFDPSQIKSATGNRGTFDPENPDIQYRPEAKDINKVAEQLGLEEVGDGAKKFGYFMREMKEKGITPRDVVKAYLITTSSINRGALSAEKVRTGWPDLVHNEKTVRPEDAFAKLLGTDDGQRFLDAAEKGEFDEAAANAMLEKFKPFGLYNTQREYMRNAAENLSKVGQAIVDAVENMPTEQYAEFVRENFKGISFGKVGFMSGMLGRGDLPTVDVRQRKLHYGDQKFNVDKQILLEVRDRLSGLDIPLTEDLKPFYQTIVHHAVWDRLEGTDTSHADIKEAMLQFRPDVDQPESRVPSYTPTKDVKNVPELTLADLKGKKIFPILADLTAVGRYKGIDSAAVVPVDLYGGPNFPLMAPNKEAGVVWANEGKGIGTRKTNLLQQTDGYAVVTAMTQDTHVSNSSTVRAFINTLDAYVKDGRVSAKGIKKADRAIKGLGVQLPSVADPSFGSAVRELSFDARKAVVGQLERAEFEEYGFPPAKRVLDAVRDPDFHGVDFGDALLVLRLDPKDTLVKLGEEGTPTHPDYTYGVRGQIVGKLKRPIPSKLLFSEFFEKRRADEAPSSADARAFSLKMPVSEVTDEKVSAAARLESQTATNAQQMRAALASATGAWASTDEPVKDGGVGVADFVRALRENKSAPSLPPYTEEMVKEKVKKGDMKVFKLDNADIYFALVRDGDKQVISSVVNNEPGARGVAGPAVLSKAILEGATHLDCFAVVSEKFPKGFLPELYSHFGFEDDVAHPLGPRVDFAREYFDADWKAVGENPDIKFADLLHLWQSEGWNPSLPKPQVTFMRLREELKSNDARQNYSRRLLETPAPALADSWRSAGGGGESDANANPARSGDGGSAGNNTGANRGLAGDRGGVSGPFQRSLDTYRNIIRDLAKLTDEDARVRGLDVDQLRSLRAALSETP